MFYLKTHSTHFILRLYGKAPSHRKDNIYHGLCYTSRGALAGTRNRSMGSSHHERTLLPRSYYFVPYEEQYITECSVMN